MSFSTLTTRIKSGIFQCVHGLGVIVIVHSTSPFTCLGGLLNWSEVCEYKRALWLLLDSRHLKIDQKLHLLTQPFITEAPVGRRLAYLLFFMELCLFAPESWRLTLILCIIKSIVVMSNLPNEAIDLCLTPFASLPTMPGSPCESVCNPAGPKSGWDGDGWAWG